MPPISHWHRCRLTSGHGVASGRAADSPYPAGTIALQTPFFADRGIDLSPFLPATLNLDAAPGEWRLRLPDARVEQLRWTDRHPPETFSFWHCRLRRPDARAGQETEVAALIYHPDPGTKTCHHQPPGLLEVLAPPLADLAPGAVLELGVDGARCRLIQPARLRARLLEFLKFRVLAAQDAFFRDWLPGDAPAAGQTTLTSQATGSGGGAADPLEQLDIAAFRHWLAAHWPEGLDLSDADLLRSLQDARRLYLP
ncbi:MAG: hypothetical protein VKO65_04655 [Cyanobacteriota bacterium]|nr:hypothetical protein [Cyanobacteriota bacterium]